jgi:hypothetical protein
MKLKDIKDMADGLGNIVSKTPAIEEMYERRKKICDECKHKNEAQNTCGLCGCFLQIKLRARYSHCPAHKWLAEPE